VRATWWPPVTSCECGGREVPARSPSFVPDQDGQAPDVRAFWRAHLQELAGIEGGPKDHWREFDRLAGGPRVAAGETFSDMLARVRQLDELYSRMARRRAAELLAAAPDYFSDEDALRAYEVLVDVAFKYPAATAEELLAILAADAFPGAKRRGRPTVWGGPVGRLLVELVDEGLAAIGIARRSRKAVRRLVGEVRDALPDDFGQWSEEELRQGYYIALREQSKKPGN
jgi:hypothetical protein